MPTAQTISDARLTRDTEAFYGALTELLKIYQFRDRDRICCYDVSVTQCYALETLTRLGRVTINDLSAELYLDKSTASRVVNALERKGYVRRVADPADGRAVRIDLTAAGTRLYARIHGDIVEHEMNLLADFDSATRQAMTEVIRRLAVAAAARVDTSGGTCCVTG